jgi:hypothetical protein
MASKAMIDGRFTVAGNGAAGEDVLILSGRPLRLRAVVQTGPDGTFEADRPARGPVALLGRARQQGLALAAADVSDWVALDAAAMLHRLTVDVQSDAGFPDRLDVFLDPLEVDGVPAELLPFATGVEPGVFNARFWEQGVTDRHLEVRLQPGVWRIGAAYIVGDRPNLVDPSFKNYVADRALADGQELPASGSGFAVEMRDDRVITLELRELPDEEL